MSESGVLQSSLALEGNADQFRLARIQLFNWGTFSGVTDLPIPQEGYLFVGPSGSGKSTVLDAHAALTTPRKWVDFNVAAREAERHGRDRNEMTYVRGAYKQATGDGGEVAAQFLRTDTTWSVIAETYRNGQGQVVTIAMVLWVRGKVTGNTDVQRRYLVLQREFDVKELEFFPRSDFDVRRFKHDMPDDHPPYTEFSAYAERFRGLLGIDSERALRLLHKTQSAKNLGDLNVFMREFMLDEPETFAVAGRLVKEFVELDEAHKAVVAARQQIQVLEPAQQQHMQWEADGRALDALDEVGAGLQGFEDQQKLRLLESRVKAVGAEVDACRQKLVKLRQDAGREAGKLTELRDRRADQGGRLLEKLEADKKDAEDRLPGLVRKRDIAQAACRTLGWSMPDEVIAFANLAAAARERVEGAADRDRMLRQQAQDARDRHRTAESEFGTVRREIQAMERQPSNIPSAYLDMRRDMAKALGLEESRLAFAGELIEVKKDQAEWRGAIERVLRGLALTILVDERDYTAVAGYMNSTHTGMLVRYSRMMQQAAGPRGIVPDSLFAKLDLADCPQQAWLREELKANYADLACTETLQEFRAARRAVTREGQVKLNSTQHRKDDRSSVGDRKQWYLGFDNKEKLELYKARALELAQEMETARQAYQAAEQEQDDSRARDHACVALQNLTWADVDVSSALVFIRDIEQRIGKEKEQRPDLAALDQQIAEQARIHERAVKSQNDEAARDISLAGELGKLQAALDAQTRRMLDVALTPAQEQSLSERLAGMKIELTLDNLERTMRAVERGITSDANELKLRRQELVRSIEGAFAKFSDTWAAEAGGLDAVMASAADYFGKLERLKKDGLDKFEARFFRLLQEQSDQNLTLLASKLEQERSAIRSRMDLVNESLLTAPYNPGTHLVIETEDKTLDDVRQFKIDLKNALSNSFSADKERAEVQFAVLRDLVKRLGSQETEADRRWQNLVLDVRQHVEFLAREREDDTDREVEVYHSGAGKSGGQRQKLTSFCLAAALRYQLGGQDRALPLFSTVVLDEAFDKADAEFTSMAMNIFKTFGFQMVVATPMKSVMTLEPFIGGACYVENPDRKTSRVLKIHYDNGSKRLSLPQNVIDAEEAALS
jgi:uncharacterized protein YPO0396